MILINKKTLIFGTVGLCLATMQTGQASILTALGLDTDKATKEALDSLGILGLSETEFEKLICPENRDALVSAIAQAAQNSKLWMVSTKNLALILKNPALESAYLDCLAGWDLAMSSYNNYQNRSAHLLLKPVLNCFDQIPACKQHELISNLLAYYPSSSQDYIARTQEYLNKQIDKISNIFGQSSTSQQWQEQIKYYPYALKTCIRYAIKHINTVDPTVIQAIIDHHPPSAKVFAEYIEAQFPHINLNIIIVLLDACPNLAPMLAQHITDNFSTIDNQIIRTFIAKRPELSELFVQPAIEQFNTTDIGVIAAIMKASTTNMHLFIQQVAANLTKKANVANMIDILSLIIQSEPTRGAQLIPVVPVILDNLEHVSEWLIRSIINQSPESIDLFAQYALKTHNPKLLAILADNDACKDKLHQVLAQDMVKNKQAFFAPFKNIGKHITQTVNHLRAHLIKKYVDLGAHGYLNYASDRALQHMTKHIIKEELCQQEKGRYTFVHAHAWFHHFYQEIYTDLWTIAQRKPSSHFKFVRYNWPFNQEAPSHTIIQQEQSIRNELMLHGVNNYYVNAGYQDRMLFMNYALFTNHSLSNSSYYIKMNASENRISIRYKRFLEQLNLAQYFTQDELMHIKEQLTQLKEEHAQISAYGGCLLLSFTPEALRSCVYVAQPGGYKGTVKVNGQETSDPQTILDTPRTDPTKISSSDHTQFVCILTYDCALQPDNGIDIYDFNAADQDKLSAWKSKKDELMRWIKERVDQRRI